MGRVRIPTGRPLRVLSARPIRFYSAARNPQRFRNSRRSPEPSCTARYAPGIKWRSSLLKWSAIVPGALWTLSMVKGDLKSRVMRPLYTRTEPRPSCSPLLEGKKKKKEGWKDDSMIAGSTVFSGPELPATRRINVISSQLSCRVFPLFATAARAPCTCKFLAGPLSFIIPLYLSRVKRVWSRNEFFVVGS